MALDLRRGCDYSQARPSKAQLDVNGLSFCCRYVLDAARDAGKRFTVTEARQLTGWGKKIVTNFEYSVGGALLGFNQGVIDAKIALAEMKMLEAAGAPKGRPIYFSMDKDIFISQIPQVLRYAEGCASVIGKNRVGLYGEYDLIDAAGKAGYKWLWQTYAWSRGLWSPYATVRQTWNHGETRNGQNGPFPGWDGDLDIAQVDDFGQWDTNGWVPGGNFMALSDSEMGEILLAARRIGDMYTMTAGTSTGRFVNLEKAIAAIGAGVSSIDGMDDTIKATLLATKAELEAAAADTSAIRAKVEAGTAVILDEEQLAAIAAAVGVDRAALVDAAKQAMREGTGPNV